MPSIGPLPSNDTCDIYRYTNVPPAAPDLAGVPVLVVPRFRNLKGNFNAGFTYTHIISLPLSADVRDNYPTDGNGDKLYVPNQSSFTIFTVNFVERVRVGGGLDYKRAYCTVSYRYPTEEG